MENQIKSALKVDGNFHSATVFGYSNKGIPGLEIVGLGNEGRIIKEKIIYFIRARSLGLPRKRIVIGVDTNGDFKKRISFEPLELPIFIIFLTLSGHLKTSTLNNCFTIGGISTLGNYIPTFFNKDLHQYIENLNELDIDNNLLAAIITPDKDIIPGSNTYTPAYLVFNNYEKILNWNRSLRFALAVCTLKNSLKNEI